MAGEGESIRALATVTLDAQALEGLGPRTIDRLADLVAERLVERRAAGEEALLSTAEAARAAGVHPDTVRRAIRSGGLRVAGYVGRRPRLRRADVESWIAGQPPSGGGATVRPWAPRQSTAARGGSRRVLRDALRVAGQGDVA